MSRSYGKPRLPFHIYFRDFIREVETDTLLDCYKDWVHGVLNKKYKYTRKNKSGRGYSERFPKSYRKQINNIRRNKDKVELFKELNLDEYTGNYSKWNCKDADPWWYW